MKLLEKDLSIAVFNDIVQELVYDDTLSDLTPMVVVMTSAEGRNAIVGMLGDEVYYSLHNNLPDLLEYRRRDGVKVLITVGLNLDAIYFGRIDFKLKV